MNRVMRASLIVALVVLLATPLMAQEKKQREKGKKGAQQRGPVAALRQQLAQLDLTADQKKKVADIMSEYGPKLRDAQSKLNLTPEQLQARRTAAQEAQEKGLKGKARTDHIRGAMKLSSEQQAAQDQMEQLSAGLRKDVLAVLTPEQKEKMGPASDAKQGKRKKRDK
jgi:Spy/CpxP family protein refolding chaperone